VNDHRIVALTRMSRRQVDRIATLTAELNEVRGENGRLRLENERLRAELDAR
jgi:regulator of replication initiation timing